MTDRGHDSRSEGQGLDTGRPEGEGDGANIYTDTATLHNAF